MQRTLKRDPEEVLALAAEKLGNVQPGDSEAATWWFFACGAGWALGTLGVLTEDQSRRWDERLQAEAQRLGLRPGGDATAPA